MTGSRRPPESHDTTKDLELVFKRIYENEHHALTRYISRKIGTDSSGVIEDIKQEVMITLWLYIQSRGNSLEQRDHRALVYQIAQYKVIDYIRAQKRRIPAIPTELGELAKVADLTDSPEGHHEAAEAAGLLDSAMGSLPFRMREVLRHSMDGKSPREIGEILGISPGTTYNYLHRGRRRVREILQVRQE